MEDKKITMAVMSKKSLDLLNPYVKRIASQLARDLNEKLKSAVDERYDFLGVKQTLKGNIITVTYGFARGELENPQEYDCVYAVAAYRKNIQKFG